LLVNFRSASTTLTPQTDAIALWDILKREITGIQLLWETVESLYFKAAGRGLATLAQDVPLFYRLAQTALMESLLMRTSRLMDPAVSGRGQGARNNLSLNRLTDVCGETATDVAAVRVVWDGSNLKNVRDKYLSHNDLARLLSEPHALNVPLDESDVKAMRELVAGLREFRRTVHSKLCMGVSFSDEGSSLQVRHEVDVLDRSLLAGELFFKLLPEHEALQRVWRDADLNTGEEK